MLFMKGAGRNARPLFLFAPIGCKRRQKLKKGSDGAMQEDEEVVKSEAEPESMKGPDEKREGGIGRNITERLVGPAGICRLGNRFNPLVFDPCDPQTKPCVVSVYARGGPDDVELHTLPACCHRDIVGF